MIRKSLIHFKSSFLQDLVGLIFFIDVALTSQNNCRDRDSLSDNWKEEKRTPSWDTGLPDPLEFPAEFLYDSRKKEYEWDYRPNGDMSLKKFIGSAYDFKC